ncbi:protein SLOW WALKER 2 [Mercurialis annua]|uniref:protein SLOW WALKER 2 n=1 Tax=Mercurialis annua TaxID=3986 RepID=UPI00215E420E|nr:protein SLOW WALKER 2 [Mercurialis annua]
MEETKNMELLQSDIATFASSLGLSTSGFDDTDFRKSTSSKKPKKNKPEIPQNTQLDKTSKNPKTFNKNEKKPQFDHKPTKNPLPKPPPLSLNTSNSSARLSDKYKNLPKLPLVKASVLGVWHVDAVEFEKAVFGEGKAKLECKMGVEEFVEKKRELGERLMWQYGHDFEQSRGQSAQIKMLTATQRSGTAADKVSAFSVIVGENPVANLRSLDALLGMVTSKVGKRHALTGFEALKELFVSSLLPDRKLKTLLQRPLNSLPETKDGYSLLLFWYWEDCLKQRYERFVSALEEASKDMLPILKDKALKTMYELLKSKSEQERRLLRGLVNKLGDPQTRSASNADYHMSNLLSDHPNMTAVVIDEVDTFLFRPHLGLRAKGIAVNFLSQIRLSHKGDGPKVAKRLLDVYFALFKVLISEMGGSQKKDKSSKADNLNTSHPVKEHKMKSSSESHVELDSRIFSALLTGINRAFPYVSSTEADDIIEIQTPLLFRMVHSNNFNVGVQALTLLEKISSKNQIVSDRFYRALYSKLLLPAAMNSSKPGYVYGILGKAMKNDVNLKRVSAFAKRLLQVSLQQPPEHACACLFLLSEILKARPPLWNMIMQNESVDEELEHFEDIVEEGDNKPSTAVKAENKREVVHRSDQDNPASDSEGEDDSVASSENDDSDDAEDDLFAKNNSKQIKELQTPSNDNGNHRQTSSTGPSLPGGYNPRHREPSYCNANCVSWWELMVLASHVHPSVATMAGTLLSGANIVYNGDPLNDLSLHAFLDKFMEKKAKQTTWHGGSRIEPAKKLDMNNHLIGPEILSLAEVDVPPEDFVFHKFYVNKMNSTKSKKKKKRKAADEEAAEELFGGRGDDEDEIDGVDESDNEEIENLLDSADVSFGADGEYDYDDLDRVANDDDDDLIGNASDVEMDLASDIDGFSNGNKSDEDAEAIEIGVMDDGSDDDYEGFNNRNRKRKSGAKAGASPFASLEDYEHLLNDESPTEKKSMTKKKPKSRKKKKSE